MVSCSIGVSTQRNAAVTFRNAGRPAETPPPARGSELLGTPGSESHTFQPTHIHLEPSL